MALPVAVSGCCTGHGCDECSTCLRGRCCRRDNPDYRLPTLGDWDGPLFGDLGRLNDDGDRVECHACGGWYRLLATHLPVHDLTAREYKRIFGLPLSQGLVGRTLSEKLAHAVAWFSDPDDPRTRRFFEARAQSMPTTEQISAVSSKTTAYEYERRKVLGLPAPRVSKAGVSLGTRGGAPGPERTCRTCGRMFSMNWKPSHHVLIACSQACSVQPWRANNRPISSGGRDAAQSSHE
jgi:hypothetical protein